MFVGCTVLLICCSDLSNAKSNAVCFVNSVHSPEQKRCLKDKLTKHVSYMKLIHHFYPRNKSVLRINAMSDHYAVNSDIICI